MSYKFDKVSNQINLYILSIELHCSIPKRKSDGVRSITAVESEGPQGGEQQGLVDCAGDVAVKEVVLFVPYEADKH